MSIQTYISGDPTAADPQATGFTGYSTPVAPATNGQINMPAGINTYTASGLGLGFNPSRYHIWIVQAQASDENIQVYQVGQGSASGFTVNFNDFLPNANYILYWEAFQ